MKTMIAMLLVAVAGCAADAGSIETDEGAQRSMGEPELACAKSYCEGPVTLMLCLGAEPGWCERSLFPGCVRLPCGAPGGGAADSGYYCCW